jgi:hypothetical protein
MHTKFWSEYLKGRLLGRPRCRSEDNIRMDVRKMRWKVGTGLMSQYKDWWWVHVYTVMNLRVP